VLRNYFHTTSNDKRLTNGKHGIRQGDSYRNMCLVAIKYKHKYKHEPRLKGKEGIVAVIYSNIF